MKTSKFCQSCGLPMSESPEKSDNNFDDSKKT